MTSDQNPRIERDANEPGRIRLSGRWTLHTALQAAEVLREVPEGLTAIDATGIEQLDSAGVLQLLRVAHRADLGQDALQFREDHQALVCTIEEVADDRPKPKRDFGVLAALDRLGRSMHATGQNIVALRPPALAGSNCFWARPGTGTTFFFHPSSGASKVVPSSPFGVYAFDFSDWS